MSESKNQNLMPYHCAYTNVANNDKQSLPSFSRPYLDALEAAGFQKVGDYTPATKDTTRYVVVFTHDQLTALMKEASAHELAGCLRLGFTNTTNAGDDQPSAVDVTCSSIEYFGSAFLAKRWSAERQGKLASIGEQFFEALKSVNAKTFQGHGYGHKTGFTGKDMSKYHYMIGMPYFNDDVTLAKFDSHDAAVAKIVDSLTKQSNDVQLVYQVNVPGVGTTFGVGLCGERGEQHFMPIIDGGELKHTCSLPYEVFVNEQNGRAYTLHGRYRIALAFPALTMATFTRIMSTPGDIENIMKQLTN